MPIACKICIAQKSLRGADVAGLPNTEEELFEHLEREHHMPVRKNRETTEQCYARFLAKYPEAATCDDCRQRGAPWAQPGE